MKRSDIVIISLIITVLLAVDIYLLSSNRTLRKEVALCDSKKDLIELGSACKKNFNNLIKNSGVSVENSLITDSANNKLHISDLFINREHIFVCRFAEEHCIDCVRDAINELQKEPFLNENTVYLCISADFNHFNKFKQKLAIMQKSVFQTGIFDIPAETNGSPYCFIIDKDLKINDIFILDSRFSQLTQEYLSLVNNKYFSVKR